MSTERTQSGYLWGEGNVEFANKDHYYAALKESRITDEEYWAQSVFHGPSHALNLRKEIFQKRIRNGVKIYSGFDDIVATEDEKIRQSVKSEETMAGVTSSNVACSTTPLSNKSSDPDTLTSFYKSLETVVGELDEGELKVLAYYIVREGIDTTIEVFMDNEEIKPLADYIREVWKLDDYKVTTLYKFIGTRYRTDCARWSIMSKFKELLDLDIEINE